MITDSRIDGGKAFDWGKASADYAKYRDIYPRELYERVLAHGIAKSGSRVLDIGTGTGVIPRNMYGFGAHFTGADMSENQIIQAQRLARESGMDIDFICCPSEELDFPKGTFDSVTACQCFMYFDHARLAPMLADMLKDGGAFAVMYMAWLPFEDKVAGESEKLILKYNEKWSGNGEVAHEISIPVVYNKYFNIEMRDLFYADIPFTRESWNGRIRSCRGIGASLSEAEIAQFEREHLKLLTELAPESFTIRHYCAIAVLRKRGNAFLERKLCKELCITLRT